MCVFYFLQRHKAHGLKKMLCNNERRTNVSGHTDKTQRCRERAVNSLRALDSLSDVTEAEVRVCTCKRFGKAAFIGVSSLGVVIPAGSSTGSHPAVSRSQMASLVTTGRPVGRVDVNHNNTGQANHDSLIKR